MTHRFNPANMHKLDNPERREILPPEKVLALTGLKEGDIFLDVGAGTGYFAIPASEITGKSGRVIAADISMEMLNEIKSRHKEGKGKIDYLLTGEDRIDLESGTADSALMAFILHEISDKKSYLKEVHRIIKPGGKFALIEWEKKEMPKGPPLHERISRDDAVKTVTEAGFKLIETEPINQYNYFMLFSRD